MPKRIMTVEMLRTLVEMKNSTPQQTDEQCAKYFGLSHPTIVYWVRKLRKANKIAPAVRGSKSQIDINSI